MTLLRFFDMLSLLMIFGAPVLSYVADEVCFRSRSLLFAWAYLDTLLISSMLRSL